MASENIPTAVASIVNTHGATILDGTTGDARQKKLNELVDSLMRTMVAALYDESKKAQRR